MLGFVGLVLGFLARQCLHGATESTRGAAIVPAPQDAHGTWCKSHRDEPAPSHGRTMQGPPHNTDSRKFSDVKLQEAPARVRAGDAKRAQRECSLLGRWRGTPKAAPQRPRTRSAAQFLSHGAAERTGVRSRRVAGWRMLTAAMPRTQVAVTEHGSFLSPHPHRAAGFTHHRAPSPKKESSYPPRGQDGSEAAWTRVGTAGTGAPQTPLVLGPSLTRPGD